MIPATEGVLRLQMKSKSSMPCTALGCMPLDWVSSAPLSLRGVCGTWNILYEASRLVVEKSVFEGRPHAAGGVETSDVVVGGLHAIGGAGQRSNRRHGEGSRSL